MDASKINGLKQYSSQKFSAGTEDQKLEESESFGEGRKLQRRMRLQKKIKASEEDKCFGGGQSQGSSSSRICEDFFPKD